MPTNPSPPELKACPTPWCDRWTPPYVFERRKGIEGVCCPVCSVSTPYFATEEEAVACWNTRPTPPPDNAELIARLREVLDDAEAMDILDDEIMNWPYPWNTDGQPNLCIGDLRKVVEALSQPRPDGDVVERVARALDALGECIFALSVPLEPVPGSGRMSSPSMRPSESGKTERNALVKAFQLVDCEFGALQEATAAVDASAIGWQLIETAPKDGSRVLVWAKDHLAPCSAEFNGTRGWCVMGPPLRHQPTHWRPLPEPPAKQEEANP